MSTAQCRIASSAFRVDGTPGSSPVKLRFAHLSLQEFLCVQHWLTRLSRGQGAAETMPTMQEMLNDGWWLNSLTLACEGRPELTNELLGSPPDLKLTGLTGDGPMRVIPRLVRAYLPETRSLDLRYVRARFAFARADLSARNLAQRGKRPERRSA